MRTALSIVCLTLVLGSAIAFDGPSCSSSFWAHTAADCDGEYVCHRSDEGIELYVTCVENGTPVWSAYELDQAAARESTASNRIYVNPEWTDDGVVGSTSSRLHPMPLSPLVPPADLEDRSGAQAAFSLSNAAPQNADLATGRWKSDVEDPVRYTALNAEGSLYVITGVLHVDDEVLPSVWWKAVCDPVSGKSIAAWVPNNEASFVHHESVAALESALGKRLFDGPECRSSDAPSPKDWGMPLAVDLATVDAFKMPATPEDDGEASSLTAPDEEAEFGNGLPNCKNFPGGFHPGCNVGGTIKGICHKQASGTEIISMCYDAKWKVPFWSHIKYTVAQAKKADESKSCRSPFRVDTSEGLTREDTSAPDGNPPNNFYGSTDYSRGHLASAKTMSYECGSDSAAWHTFWMTNTAPQIQSFNAGRWLKIAEEGLRNYMLSKAKDVVFVATGSIHNNEYIPDTTVARPDIFWKSLCDLNAGASVVAWSKNIGEGQAGAEMHFDAATPFAKATGYTILPAACAPNAASPIFFGSALEAHIRQIKESPMWLLELAED